METEYVCHCGSKQDPHLCPQPLEPVEGLHPDWQTVPRRRLEEAFASQGATIRELLDSWQLMVEENERLQVQTTALRFNLNSMVNSVEIILRGYKTHDYLSAAVERARDCLKRKDWSTPTARVKGT